MEGSSIHFDASPEGTVPLKISAEGLGAKEPTTVIDKFKKTVEDHGDRTALVYKASSGAEYTKVTWNKYYALVKRAAKAFIHLGLEPHHSVAIIGFNHPAWHIADLGAIFARGFASGVYTTNGPQATLYVVNHSRSQFVVVEDKKQLLKLIEVQDDLTHVKAIIVYNDPSLTESEIKALNCKHTVYQWDAFLQKGDDPAGDEELNARMAVQQPNDCCTLIYTSGTTGDPKAVMATHDNITWLTYTIAKAIGVEASPFECLVSYLPLSHIAAQIIDIHAPMVMGGELWFAEPTALKGSLKDTLADARPTVFLGVPRVWEKFEEAMRAAAAQASPLTKYIASWAKYLGYLGSQARIKGEPLPFGWSIANWLVFQTVRQKLGLDRCHFFATGAAPITKETLDFFLSLDIQLMDVYGLSESSGPISLCTPSKYKSGSAGHIIEGTEVMILNPDEDGCGEVCVRGRQVFKGYLFNDAKSNEAIDEEGWLHTGDIGKLDDDGFLFITGRIKELLITAGGENVAPVPIEDRIKAACPLIGNCMLIGDKRKYLTVLVTLKCEVNADTMEPTDALTPPATQYLEGQGISVKTVSEAAKDERIHDLIQKALETANADAISRAQRVQKFKILPKDFSVPNGELGPTLKLRRPIVVKKYQATIDSLY